MLESTPSRPYGGHTGDLLVVEANMRLRRQLIESLLRPNERLLTQPVFPLMGVGQFTQPGYAPHGPVACSAYIPDELIGEHPRFATLTRNIRLRRGRKVDIRVPVFQDAATRGSVNKYCPSGDETKTHAERTETKLEQEIHMDAMAFGMGACCLQVTFQTQSLDEARHLYDHLAVLAPIMLAMTASTPFLRGMIADTDVRWHTISESVDDRTPVELGTQGDKVTCETPMLAGLVGQASAPALPSLSLDALDALSPVSPVDLERERSGSGSDSDESRVADPFATPTGAALIGVHDHPAATTTVTTADTDLAAAGAGAGSDPGSGSVAESKSGSEVTEAASAAAAAAAAGGDVSECLWGRDRRLAKSRYAAISTFLSTQADFKPHYNDIELKYDKEAYDTLVEGGVDPLLARHVAHLWVRDPLVIYEEDITAETDDSTDHFENLQSTNWQTVRFKPPPLSGEIGWRVEFRSMEVSLTDFENAAFTVFIALVSRAILYFPLNLYMPISKIDENMERAHARDAVHSRRFFWRSDITSCVAAARASGAPDAGVDKPDADQKEVFEEMTMKEIFCGKLSSQYPGLIPLVKTYLDMIKCDDKSKQVVHRYLKFIEDRANGTLMTPATWLRKYAEVHPSYKQDSVLPEDLVHDLTETCSQISKGNIEVPQLLGTLANLEESKHATVTSDDPSETERGPYLKGAPRAHAALSKPLKLRLPSSKGCSVFLEFLRKHLPNCCEGGKFVPASEATAPCSEHGAQAS